MKLRMKIGDKDVELEGEVGELRNFVGISENPKKSGNEDNLILRPVVVKSSLAGVKLKGSYLGIRLDPYYRKAFHGRSLYAEIDRLIALGITDNDVNAISKEMSRAVKDVGCRKSAKAIYHLIRRNIVWRLHGGKRKYEKPKEVKKDGA